MKSRHSSMKGETFYLKFGIEEKSTEEQLSQNAEIL